MIGLTSNEKSKIDFLLPKNAVGGIIIFASLVGVGLGSLAHDYSYNSFFDTSKAGWQKDLSAIVIIFSSSVLLVLSIYIITTRFVKTTAN